MDEWDDGWMHGNGWDGMGWDGMRWMGWMRWNRPGQDRREGKGRKSGPTRPPSPIDHVKSAPIGRHVQECLLQQTIGNNLNAPRQGTGCISCGASVLGNATQHLIKNKGDL